MNYGISDWILTRWLLSCGMGLFSNIDDVEITIRWLHYLQNP